MIFLGIFIKNIFPNGNEEEFNKAFVTFDVSKEEFEQIKNDNNGNFVCLETVVFDLNLIKSHFNIKNISNKFRKV